MSFYAFRKPMANDVYINHYRTTPKLGSDLVLVFYGLALYLVMRFKNLEKKEICKNITHCSNQHLDK